MSVEGEDTRDFESTVHVTSTAAEPRKLHLLVFGDGFVERHTLPKRGLLVIGRASKVAVRIEHPSVSREHARLHVADRVLVEDLGSHNGTRIGSIRVPAGERVPIGVGVSFRVGSVMLSLQGAASVRARRKMISVPAFERTVSAIRGQKKNVEVLSLHVDGGLPVDVIADAIGEAALLDDLLASKSPRDFLLAIVGDSGAATERRVALLEAKLRAMGAQLRVEGAKARRKPADPDLRDDARHRAMATTQLVLSLYAQGREEEARSQITSALEDLRSVDDGMLQSFCLVQIGAAAQECGALEDARDLYARALEIERRAGRRKSEVVLGSYLASCRRVGDARESAAAPGTLKVDVRERSIRTPAGTEIDLGRRKSLWLIFDALVEAHLKAPGTAVRRDILMGRGWPGERIHPEAAANRLYVAIAMLRRIGLRDEILLRDDGYLLVPALDVVRK